MEQIWYLGDDAGWASTGRQQPNPLHLLLKWDFSTWNGRTDCERSFETGGRWDHYIWCTFATRCSSSCSHLVCSMWQFSCLWAALTTKGERRNLLDVLGESMLIIFIAFNICLRTHTDWQVKTPIIQGCTQNHGAGFEAHIRYQKGKKGAVKTGAEEKMWAAWKAQSSTWPSSWSLQVYAGP